MSVAIPARVGSFSASVPRLLSASAGIAVLLLVLCACGGTSGQPTGPQVASQAEESTSGDVGSVAVREAYIPTPPNRVYPPGSGIVVELVLRNSSSSWDELTSVTTPVASDVTLSQLGITQDFISLPSEPTESYAIAELKNATRTVAPGQKVPVTFHFRSAGSLTLQVPVRTRTVASNST